MGFMDLEKVYDRVNRETIWKVLRMYGVYGKLLSGIKSMYVNILACVRVKGDESECFRIEINTTFSLVLQHVNGYSNERGESGDGEDGIKVSGGGKRVNIVWFLVCK